jgi:hypothetical protein
MHKYISILLLLFFFPLLKDLSCITNGKTLINQASVESPLVNRRPVADDKQTPVADGMPQKKQAPLGNGRPQRKQRAVANGRAQKKQAPVANARR